MKTSPARLARASGAGTPHTLDFAAARAAMARDQLRPAGIRDARVLAAMAAVPRERFVPEALRERAYDDSPLPIGEGQTISQPAMVAWMVEAARLTQDDLALEVGAGCGYAAAVIAQIASRVIAVERLADLAEAARRRLDALAIGNVELRTGDGTGEVAGGPFDAILVSAAAREVPAGLRAQLKIGGRMIVPVGGRSAQSLLRLTRVDADRVDRENLGGVRFVPLIVG